MYGNTLVFTRHLAAITQYYHSQIQRRSRSSVSRSLWGDDDKGVGREDRVRGNEGATIWSYDFRDALIYLLNQKSRNLYPSKCNQESPVKSEGGGGEYLGNQ
jgi:hypothetical protein